MTTRDAKAIAIRNDIKSAQDATSTSLAVGSNNRADELHLREFLDVHPQVKFVRYIVNPYGNKLKAQATTTTRALAIAVDPRAAGLSSHHPVNSQSTTIKGYVSEFDRPSADAWIPDWTSLAHLGEAAPRHASVMCFVEEEGEASDSTSKEDGVEARCPRRVLERNVNHAKNKHGIDFLVGSEIEFMILDSVQAKGPVQTPSHRWAAGAFRCEYFKNVVEESVLALEKAGVPIWNFTAEGGLGAFEISLGPLPPMQAIDSLVFSREVIKSMAHEHGCHATMFPLPFEDEAPAGAHLHISLTDGGKYGDMFLAGILKHYRAMCSLMMAAHDSYGVRLDSMGGGAISWGWENRGNPVRRIKDGHFEIRTPDGTANMYLVLAAIIGVGIRAIEAKQELTVKNKESTDDDLSNDQLKELGVTDKIPRDLAEAVAATRGDEVLKEVLGEKCFDRYIALKNKEVELSKSQLSTRRREDVIQYI